MFIEIFGEKGKSGQKPLSNKGNNFERAQVDIFKLVVHPLFFS